MNEEQSLDLMAADLRALEESLLGHPVRSSPELLDQLLADDFVEFGASGRVYTKEEVLAHLPQAPQEEFSVENFRMRRLAPGLVLITYTLTRAGNPATSPRSLRSSIWSFQHGRWEIVFHQGTPID